MRDVEGAVLACGQIACGRLARAAAHAGTEAAEAIPVLAARREDSEAGSALETGNTETVEQWTATDGVPKWELGVDA